MSTSSAQYFDEDEFPIQLVFSRDDPCNTTISLNEKPLYIVKTRRETIKTRTGRPDLLCTTDVYTPAGALVMTLAWNDSSSDTITRPARGLDNVKLNNWMKKSINPFSSDTTFKDIGGNTYKWDTKGPRNQHRLLADKATMITYFERANPYVNLQQGYNYNPEPKPSRLHLSYEADVMREDVLLSFLIVERERRQRDRQLEIFADSQALARGAAFPVLPSSHVGFAS